MTRRIAALASAAAVACWYWSNRRRLNAAGRASDARIAVDRAVAAGDVARLEDEVLVAWHRDPARVDPVEANLARRRAIGLAALAQRRSPAAL